MPQRTFGDAPRYRYGAGAVVYNDTLYLMCGTSSGPDKDYRVVQQKLALTTTSKLCKMPSVQHRAGSFNCLITLYSNNIHALDLKSWTWTRLSPGGSPPVKCAYLSTWLHNGKLYGFGGETSENPQAWLPDSYQMFRS